jgi:hypothetical protein
MLRLRTHEGKIGDHDGDRQRYMQTITNSSADEYGYAPF